MTPNTEPRPIMADERPIAIDAGEAAEDLRRIVELNRRIDAAKLRALDSADVAKADKKAVEALQDELNDLIHEVASPRPLLAGQSAHAAADAWEAGGPDGWRDEAVAALSAFGLVDSLLTKLDEAGVRTLGDLADCPDLTAIRGIGDAAAERIADAAAAWHAAHRPAEAGANGDDETEAS